MPIRYDRKVSADLRQRVTRRDGHKCQLCGLDLIWLAEKAFPKRRVPNRFISTGIRLGFKLLEHEVDFTKEQIDLMKRYLEELELAARLHAEHPWLRQLSPDTALGDIDHIEALALGGTNEIGNLRLLCKGCHRAQSAILRGQLARRPVKKSTKERL